MSLSGDIQDVLARYQTRQKEAALSQKELSSEQMPGTMTSDNATLLRKVATTLREAESTHDVTLGDVKAFINQ